MSKTEKAAKASSVNIEAKSINQQYLIDSIQENDITFAIGPAGTGKTLISSAMAAKGVEERRYGKIIFTRPAVTADEDLGHLPGTMEEKLNPYMMPIFDSLEHFWQYQKIEDMIYKGFIEIAAVGFLRGRSFYEAFIVVDEAQNLTKEQMLMVVTRFGKGCKMVINGDITQCDLPKHKESGLTLAYELIDKKVKGVGMVEFEYTDIKRHPVVSNILKALEE